MGEPTLGNGKICYIEIPAEDVAVSSKFYADVFGWKLRTRGDGEIAFDDGVGQVSGTWVTGRKAMSNVEIVIYVMVDDIKASVAKVKECGGKIERDVDMNAREKFAWFKDPAGNVMGIYQQ
jgi:predicted enzyme related to lactoylglutathione lyase